jgi:hypothetical protein
MRMAYLILFTILLTPAVASFGPNGTPMLPAEGRALASGELAYPAQSFECEVDREGASARIAQTLTLRCTGGCIEGVRVVIPYGGQEIEPTGMVALTPTGESLTRAVEQNGSHTEAWVELRVPISENQDAVVILRYTIQDRPGEDGIAKPVLSFLDRLLGRDPSRFEITYRPGVFDEGLDKLIIRTFAPLDLLPLSWEPEADGSKFYDPLTGRVSINWQLEEDIPRVPVFRVLFGKERGPDPAPVILGLLILAIIIVGALTVRIPAWSQGRP